MLHITFAKCLIALAISTSLGLCNAYCICIHLVTAIIMYPQQTLLHPLPDLCQSLIVKFVPYVNCVITIDTDTVTTSRGQGTRARTHTWDITADHGFSFLCDEHQHSVKESEGLHDAKHIGFWAGLHPRWRCLINKTLQAYIYIRLASPPYLQSPKPSTHPPHRCYHFASPLIIYLTPLKLV